MQTAGCKNERLEAQNGLHTDRLAMGSFIPAHPTSTFRIFLSCQRNFRRVRLHVYRSRLYDSVPDVCRYMGRSGETCQKPEQPERTGCYLPAYVSEIQFLVMEKVAALYPERAVFDHADKGRFAMFDKVSGSKQIRERFSKRNRWEDIREYWYKDVEDFRKLSKPYYLYK